MPMKMFKMNDRFLILQKSARPVAVTSKLTSPMEARATKSVAARAKASKATGACEASTEWPASMGAQVSGASRACEV